MPHCNKAKKIIMAFVLAIMSAPLLADDMYKILGFEIGKPISLPACLEKNGNYPIYVDSTCIQPPQKLKGYDKKIRRISLASDESPYWLKFNRLFAFEDNGILLGVLFVTTGYETQDIVASSISHKLGHEGSSEDYVLRNNFGTEFIVKWVNWRGREIKAEYRPSVNIYDSSLNDLESATVTYETEEGRKYRESIQTEINNKIRAL